MAIIKAAYPKTWSKRHRVTTAIPQLIEAFVCEDQTTMLADGPSVYFRMQDHEFFYDEFPTVHYDTTVGSAEVVLREIPGKVIFHEVGNSNNDCVLHSVVLQGQEIEPLGTVGSPDYHTDLYTWTENTLEEPKLKVALRSTAYANHIDFGTTIDLVKLNLKAWGDTNVYAGIRQPPGTAGSHDEPTVSRESVRLLAPTSKFRRARTSFETLGYTVMIRGMVMVYQDYGRKGYG